MADGGARGRVVTARAPAEQPLSAGSGAARSAFTGSRLDQAAAAALREWSCHVAVVPLFAAREEQAERLRDLVAWYQRVARRPTCTELPALEALGVLDELADAAPTVVSVRVGLARWAVRVGEELVRLRAWSGTAASAAMSRLASSRLEQTLRAARRELDEREPDSAMSSEGEPPRGPARSARGSRWWPTMRQRP